MDRELARQNPGRGNLPFPEGPAVATTAIHNRRKRGPPSMQDGVMDGRLLTTCFTIRTPSPSGLGFCPGGDIMVVSRQGKALPVERSAGDDKINADLSPVPGYGINDHG